MVRTPCFHCHDPGSVPGGRIKILKTKLCGQGENKKKSRHNSWTESKSEESHYTDLPKIPGSMLHTKVTLEDLGGFRGGTGKSPSTPLVGEPASWGNDLGVQVSHTVAVAPKLFGTQGRVSWNKIFPHIEAVGEGRGLRWFGDESSA